MKGERVKSVAELQIGHILLEYSNQFDTENTIKVTRLFDGRVWAQFVNADNTDEIMGEEFAIWNYEIVRGSLKLWYAETAAKPQTRVRLELPAEAAQRLLELTPEQLKELSELIGIPVLEIRKVTLKTLEDQMEEDDPAACTQMEWEAEPLASLRAAIEEETNPTN